jgi:MYXO-CTERM domain-containing protein
VQIQVDRTGPATAPTISPALPTITNAASVTVAGTTEAGATVTIRVTGLAPVTATADGTGHYTASAPLPAADGPTEVTVQSADALGNPSPVSAPVTLEVDRTGPSAPPTIAPALPASTRAASLTVGGTTEANATVTIQVTGMPAVVTTGDAAGAWSTSVPLPAADGGCDVTVTASDVAGNASPASTPVTVTVDRTGPATAPTIAPAPPARTNAASAMIAGTTEANATVTVRVTGMAPVTTTADGVGDYSVPAPLPAADGSYSVTVQAADALGNLSPVSAPVGIVVDRTAPAGAPTMDPLPTLTNAPSVTVSGTTEGNATVTILVAGLAPVSTIADGAGNYSVSAPLPAADGAYAVTVRATDVAGNPSPVSAPVTVQVDRTPPAAAPTIAPPLPAATNTVLVTVAGTTEANATVTVLVNGTLAVTTSADGSGAWSVGAALPPGDGAYDVQVRASDLAGNASPLSAPSTVVLDRTGPAAPTLTPALPALTNATSLTVAGTTEANATVTVQVTGMTAVTTTADGAGGWSVSAPLPASDGSCSVTVQSADALGNLSPLSAPVSVTVDRTGPATAPTLAPALPALTNATSLTVAGTTEANATVTVRVTGMAPVTTTADGAGAWSVSAPLPASDGSCSVTVQSADALGNLSPLSAAVAVEVDRTAPALAIITAPAAGASLLPGTVTVSGTAEPGATVAIVVDGAAPVQVAADAGTGAFQIDVSLTDGNHFVTVTVTDPAGNTSAAADRSFVVATPAPPAEPGGGCGCGSNGASAPEALLLMVLGLLAFRRRIAA